jgi:hypothetical protein
MRAMVHACSRAVWLIVCSSLAVHCAWFDSTPHQDIAMTDRLRVAILPVAFNVDITSLSAVRTVAGELSEEEELRELADTLYGLRQEARWILQSRLATRHVFRFVALEEVEAAVADCGVEPGALLTSDHIIRLGRSMNADLVIVATIEDYGKVRWQWLLAGMLTDMTIDNIIIGLATAWNPVALSASIGWDVLTSAPIWFGGGYFFGVAFRPVRVEARAYDTRHGYPIWQHMETAIYAWKALTQLPAAERKKKERQLWINLDIAMEALADSLADEHFTADVLREHEDAR